MRFIPRISLWLSFISIISFALSELGYDQIPVLSPIGLFAHEYWFADYSERYKRRRGTFAIDGPPLVVSPGDGGQVPWPYSAPGNGSIPFQYTESYYEVAHDSSKYTPVDGVGGVVKSNIKPKQSPGSVKYSYPQAQSPGDYIANRFLGKGFSQGFSSLEEISMKGEVEYNKNVFKNGTPFKAALIGGGKPNDPRWETRPRYQSNLAGHQLLVPLTSGATGDMFQNPQVQNVMDVNRDYSGGEYTQSDIQNGVYSTNTLEGQSVKMSSHRPVWYKQTANGNYIDIDTPSVVWAGDLPDVTAQQHQTYTNSPFIMNTFTNHGSAVGGIQTVGWGEPSSVENKITGMSPVDMQKNYIASQIAQENPIQSI